MENIVILGAGQQGRICKELAFKNGYNVCAFVDDYETGKVEGVEVYRKIENIDGFHNYKYFVAIGDIRPRRKFCDELERLHLRTINLIDETACIEEGANIGTGNFIYKFAIIYSSAKIGDNNIINCKAVVATDSIIGNNCNISMGCNICGGVTVGDDTYIGCQASVVSGINIGKNVVIAAGSSVIRDVGDDKFMAGVPAVEKRR